jgi:hypothetical protein
MVMVLAVIYLLLTGRHFHWGEPESVGTTASSSTNLRMISGTSIVEQNHKPAPEGRQFQIAVDAVQRRSRLEFMSLWTDEILNMYETASW